LPQDLPTVAVSDLAEHWLREHLERKGTMPLHLFTSSWCIYLQYVWQLQQLAN
jgi:hypothetical protein